MSRMLGQYAEVTSIIEHSRACWDDTHVVARTPIKAPQGLNPHAVFDPETLYQTSPEIKIRLENFGSVIQNRRQFTIRAFNVAVTDLLVRLSEPSKAMDFLESTSKTDLEFLVQLMRDGYIIPSNSLSSSTSSPEIYHLPPSTTLLRSPIAVDFEITLRCGRKCSYCAYRSGPDVAVEGELGFDFWDALLHQARDAGVLAIEFTGGDPLMHPNGLDIVRRADELGFFYTINSDLTRTTDEQMDELSQLKNLIAVQTTIDGADADINDLYRGKGAFRHMIDGVARLRNKGIAVHAGMIVSSSNFDQVASVALKCREIGIEALFVGALYSAGRAREMRSNSIATNEQLGVASRAYALAITEGVVRPVHPSFYALLPSFESNPEAFNHLADNPNMVNVGLYNLRIDPEGRAFTSIKLEDSPYFIVGDLTIQSLQDIWNGSAQLRELRTLYASADDSNHYHALNTTSFGGLEIFVDQARGLMKRDLVH